MIPASDIETKTTTLGHQERKKEIIVFLAKNEGSNIKTIMIKRNKGSHLHPEKVLMIIFPGVLSQFLTIGGLRTP